MKRIFGQIWRASISLSLTIDIEHCQLLTWIPRWDSHSRDTYTKVLFNHCRDPCNRPLPLREHIASWCLQSNLCHGILMVKLVVSECLARCSYVLITVLDTAGAASAQLRTRRQGVSNASFDGFGNMLDMGKLLRSGLLVPVSEALLTFYQVRWRFLSMSPGLHNRIHHAWESNDFQERLLSKCAWIEQWRI